MSKVAVCEGHQGLAECEEVWRLVKLKFVGLLQFRSDFYCYDCKKRVLGHIPVREMVAQ
jgi:hypothetical protein